MSAIVERKGIRIRDPKCRPTGGRLCLFVCLFCLSWNYSLTVVFEYECDNAYLLSRGCMFTRYNDYVRNEVRLEYRVFFSPSTTLSVSTKPGGISPRE